MDRKEVLTVDNSTYEEEYSDVEVWINSDQLFFKLAQGTMRRVFTNCRFHLEELSGLGNYINCPKVIFRNCQFMDDLYIRNLNLLDVLHFEDCRFSGNFNLSDIQEAENSPKAGIMIKDCIFEGDVSIDIQCLSEISVLHSVVDSLTILGKDVERVFISDSTVKSYCELKGKIKNVVVDGEKFPEKDFCIGKDVEKIQFIRFTVGNCDDFFDRIGELDSHVVKTEFVFYDCIFGEKLSFSERVFRKRLVFQRSVFKGDVDLRWCKFSAELDMSESVFNGEVNLCDACFDSGLEMSDTVFEKNLLMVGTQVQDVDFTNAVFNGRVKIVEVVLGRKCRRIEFERAKVNEMLYFNAFEEGKELRLGEGQVVSFRHLFVERTGYVIIRKINSVCGEKSGTFDFEYANVFGALTVQESFVDTFLMEKATITGSVTFQGMRFNRIDLKDSFPSGRLVVNGWHDEREKPEAERLTNRQTACVLKKACGEGGDMVSYLRFKQAEMKLYTREFYAAFPRFYENPLIKKSLLLKKACLSVAWLFLLVTLPLYFWRRTYGVRRAQEFILLFLNKMSNNFGLSWTRGVAFTMGCAACFYFLMNYMGVENKVFVVDLRICRDGYWQSFGEVWKGYLELLNLFNFKDYIWGVELNAVGTTLFFLSRIFISYGIYQTVSAFRKYGK